MGYKKDLGDTEWLFAFHFISWSIYRDDVTDTRPKWEPTQAASFESREKDLKFGSVSACCGTKWAVREWS